ncbi:MAG: hypothetical protein ACSHYA_09050 [Opitutaceae bacterium]
MYKAKTEFGLPAFTLSLAGGVNVLRLPDEAPTEWAVSTSASIHINTVNFNYSLSDLLGSPLTLVELAPYKLVGDLSIQRQDGGAVRLGVEVDEFLFNEEDLGSLSGEVGSDLALSLQGSFNNGFNLPLIPSDVFRIENNSGGPATFSLKIEPDRFTFSVPRGRLHSDVFGFPSAGLPLPALNLDTSGDFNTRELPLPDWSFNGIEMAPDLVPELFPLDEDLSGENYIRLRRIDGVVRFDSIAQIPFLPLLPLHEIALDLNSNGDASGYYKGRFGIPFIEPQELHMDTSAECLFEGNIAGFNVKFDSDCASITPQ